MRYATLAPLLCGGVAACAAGADARRDAWVAEYDTVGDTIVVRTVSGGEWGPVELVPEISIGELDSDREAYLIGQVTGLAVDAAGNIYAYDNQVPALRKYGPDGVFITTFGRKGGGPGEYANSDGGLLVLPGGRILLRDPGNARFTLYHPDGTLADEWLGRGGFFTSTPPFADTAGNVYNPVIEDWPEGKRPPTGDMWRWRMVRYSIDGAPLDTLDIPEYDYERAVIRAEVTRGGTGDKGGGVSRMMNNVPFAPTFAWTMSPFGWFVAGVGNRYAIDQYLPDGRVLRIERAAEPVPVAAAERADAEERAVANMRGMDPSWRWNGPPIPDQKPAFSSFFAGLDGRIWVQRPAPGELIPEGELDEPRALGNGVTMPPQRYREPVVYEVFEPDGRFLGTVRAPKGFSAWPRPVARGDFVWAIVRDDLGVNRIQRFRITPVAVQ
jgi:hypothetical protein